jgi:hypothetical protein
MKLAATKLNVPDVTLPPLHCAAQIGNSAGLSRLLATGVSVDHTTF